MFIFRSQIGCISRARKVGRCSDGCSLTGARFARSRASVWELSIARLLGHQENGSQLEFLKLSYCRCVHPSKLSKLSKTKSRSYMLSPFSQLSKESANCVYKDRVACVQKCTECCVPRAVFDFLKLGARESFQEVVSFLETFDVNPDTLLTGQRTLGLLDFAFKLTKSSEILGDIGASLLVAFLDDNNNFVSG
jgi:hypothetical protein